MSGFASLQIADFGLQIEMPLTPGSRLGSYEVISAVGAGGMGEVYRARDTGLDRTVALKVLSAAMAAEPQFRERFEREARSIAALNHPHICTLYDVGGAQSRRDRQSPRLWPPPMGCV